MIAFGQIHSEDPCRPEVPLVLRQDRLATELVLVILSSLLRPRLRGARSVELVLGDAANVYRALVELVRYERRRGEAVTLALEVVLEGGGSGGVPCILYVIVIEVRFTPLAR